MALLLEYLIIGFAVLAAAGIFAVSYIAIIIKQEERRTAMANNKYAKKPEQKGQ